MDTVFIAVSLFIIGSALGSFAGAQVWRLRARQLVLDKQAGEKVSEKEYKRLLPLTKQSVVTDHSIDLDTGKRLPWYDLIPVLSWLLLRGRSRFSGKPIGYFEFLIELGVGVFFVTSFLLWPENLVTPLQIIRFALWLLAGVCLAILFAYDAKWFLLPDRITLVFVILGLLYAGSFLVASKTPLDLLVSIAGSLVILSGLYLLLYIISRGRWIGFGDIKLGVGLALFVVDWRLAFIALFLANLYGTLLVLPGLISGKLKRSTHVPFGPLLILGMITAVLVGNNILNWYMSIILP
jgi:leader peptidase (prepilin peptidase)/N-methyltransferase